MGGSEFLDFEAWMFDVPGIWGLRVLGFLGLWPFGPMTLKPGTAASRSVNNLGDRIWSVQA